MLNKSSKGFENTEYLSIDGEPYIKKRKLKNVYKLIVLAVVGFASIYCYYQYIYSFEQITSFLSSIKISKTTDETIQSYRIERQKQKDIEIHYYPMGELSDMPENLRSTAMDLLLEEGNDMLNQEASHINKDMRDSYPDMREIEFQLRYAQEVESGIRGPELEPEWEWAANISIVYTWVNGSEPVHLQQKSLYNGGKKKPDNRDRCVDELRYSIRSLLKNLVWHKGTIYIVSPTNHVPEWLDPSYDRIKVIDQADLLPAKNVLGEDVNPTFNSFAIEWYLDKIEGVSEQFIQINDDYFFRRPVHPSVFFYGGGEGYNLNPSLVKPLSNNEKILRENKKFNHYRKGTSVTSTGIWDLLYGSGRKTLSNIKRIIYSTPQRIYRRGFFSFDYNFVPLPDPMIHYAFDDDVLKNMEDNFENIDEEDKKEEKDEEKAKEKAKEKNDSIIVMRDIYGQNYTLDLSNGVYNGLIDKEEYEKKNWSPDFTNLDKKNAKSIQRKPSLMDKAKKLITGDKEKEYTKTYYPNAARHFHFPIIYMENRRVDRNIEVAKRTGYKGTFETTWGQKFEAAEAITTHCIKSFFGEELELNSLYHAPYVFYRDLYEPSRQLYYEYLNLTLTHRFRDGFDILPPISKLLYLRYYASAPDFEEELDKKYNMAYVYDSDGKEIKNEDGNKKPRTVLKYGFHIMSEEYVKKLFTFGAIYDNSKKNEMLFKRIMESPTLLMYNLNDDYTLPEAGEQLRAFLKYMYPEPGPFEKEYKEEIFEPKEN